MFDKLDRVLGAGNEAIRGLWMLVECDPRLSPLFLQLYALVRAQRQGRPVAFISLDQTVEMIKIAAGKLSLRVDSNLLHFFPLKNFLPDNGELVGLSVGDLAKAIAKAIKSALGGETAQNSPPLLIVDDPIDLLEGGGGSQIESIRFFQTLRRELPEGAGVMAIAYLSDTGGRDSFSPSIRHECFRTVVGMSPIGAGFGRNITGQLEVVHWDPWRDIAPPSRTLLHYCCGRRSVQLFVPGSKQLLM